MSFSDTEQFSGKKVVQWQVGKPLPNTANNAVKLAINPYDDDPAFPDYFAEFIKLSNLETIDTLLIGAWGEAYEEKSSLAVNLLVEKKHLFPNLTSLFIGDLALEEAEVSWIQQSDVSSVYAAFPKLETLKLRGGEGLSLGNLNHNRLQRLVIETGGMGADILGQSRLAKLPELTHLELWLGDENYGCDLGQADIRAFLNGLSEQFPKLRYLGLRNYYMSDQLAAILADVGAPQSLYTLDLSLGNLSDEGAMALLGSDKFSHLKLLDLHHHYLSDEMMAKVAAAQLAPQVNLEEQEAADVYDDEVYRYIFVSE